MREFDHDGLLLAEYQGKIFEKSTELKCSTAIFLRRFLHSDFVKKLDMNDVTSLTLDVNEGIDNIQSQFGETDYGKTKYSKGAMFWIGYMYRYLSYTREVTTKFVMNLFPHKQLNDVYYSFHTQDPEWCVRSLLEMNGQSEDVFDNNARLKAVISACGKY
ncbi:MAG: antitoxin [Lachnospiraceae bacterium]|nr:antitoxin [Lachnospiraceae bacterium]